MLENTPDSTKLLFMLRFSLLVLSTLLLTTSLLAGAVEPQKHITFTCSESSNSPLFKMLEIVFSRFFEPHGYSFSMQTTTEQRMISEVSSGRIDGACGQNKPMFDTLNDPNIIRTTTPIANLAIRALSRKELSAIRSLKGLQHSTLRIGIIASTGTALAAQQQGVHFDNIVTIDRGVRMLAANRLDYVISNHIQIHRALNELGSLTPLYVSDTLFSLPLHTIFNQRHLALIPSLDHYLSQLNQCLDGPLSQRNSALWLSLSTQSINDCLKSKTIDEI